MGTLDEYMGLTGEDADKWHAEHAAYLKVQTHTHDTRYEDLISELESGRKQFWPNLLDCICVNVGHGFAQLGQIATRDLAAEVVAWRARERVRMTRGGASIEAAQLLSDAMARTDQWRKP